MTILLATLSIFAIAFIAYLLRKIGVLKICPICAGVSGTWLWLLGAHILGYQVDMFVVSIMIGGSVVGIAYQLEKRMADARGILFKALFIPVGFIAAYGILEDWKLFAVAIIGIVAISVYFLSARTMSATSAEKEERVKNITDQMKNCC